MPETAVEKRRPGRPMGAENKRTVAIRQRMIELGCDPVAGLASIAADVTVEAQTRVKAYAELMKYSEYQLKVEPPPSHVEHMHTHTVSVDDRLAEYRRRNPVVIEAKPVA